MPEPFFILFVHPHATQCICMMTDVKMSVEKMKFAKDRIFSNVQRSDPF